MNTDPLPRDLLKRDMARMRVELAGTSPTPLEVLLVGRIAACWLQVQHADPRVGNADAQSVTLTLGAYYRDR